MLLEQQPDEPVLDIIADNIGGELSSVSAVLTHGSAAPAAAAAAAPENNSERDERKGSAGSADVKTVVGRSQGGDSADGDDGSSRDQASAGVVSKWSAEKLREFSKVILFYR